MILEPYFYLIAVVSVFLHGMGKGGFIGAGSFGSLLAIPMLSIFIPPFQAVAILLLPLIFMDLVTVWRYRRMWDKKILKFIVPLAFIGIIIGTLSFSYLSEDSVRVIIGLMAVIFCLDYYLRKNSAEPRKPSLWGSYFWPSLSGFTSFSIHAGGLPLSFYLLPMRLDQKNICCYSRTFLFANKFIQDFPLCLFRSNELSKYLYVSIAFASCAYWGLCRSIFSR